MHVLDCLHERGRLAFNGLAHFTLEVLHKIHFPVGIVNEAAFAVDVWEE